jgi:DNA-binding transcriptional MerR regulator
VTSHTIGEVLNQLKGEFDDITISKIRFLEAEGLISPDRTESGYRKFTPEDVQRLRYVLRAQRDRYLPLKVIKDELARLDAGLDAGLAEAAGDGEVEADGSSAPAAGDSSAPGGGPAAARDRPATSAGAGGGAGAGGSAARLLDGAPTEVQLSAEELATASGLDDGQLTSLRDHGLLGPGPAYDGDDLQVARFAAALLRSGLEVRHLRMYLQFASREASVAEALVAPLLRQRNPASRRAAIDHAEHLAVVGGQLHRALLVKQLRALLRS